MTLPEVVLIIMLGYSPSGATGVDMEVKEYKQQTIELCNAEAFRLTELETRRFHIKAFCTTRIREE